MNIFNYWCARPLTLTGHFRWSSHPGRGVTILVPVTAREGEAGGGLSDKEAKNNVEELLYKWFHSIPKLTLSFESFSRPFYQIRFVLANYSKQKNQKCPCENTLPKTTVSLLCAWKCRDKCCLAALWKEGPFGTNPAFGCQKGSNQYFFATMRIAGIGESQPGAQWIDNVQKN